MSENMWEKALAGVGEAYEIMESLYMQGLITIEEFDAADRDLWAAYKTIAKTGDNNE